MCPKQSTAVFSFWDNQRLLHPSYTVILQKVWKQDQTIQKDLIKLEKKNTDVQTLQQTGLDDQGTICKSSGYTHLV